MVLARFGTGEKRFEELWRHVQVAPRYLREQGVVDGPYFGTVGRPSIRHDLTADHEAELMVIAIATDASACDVRPREITVCMERGSTMLAQKLLIDWLNDAYGMESSLLRVLPSRVEAAHDAPQLEAKLRQHLEETRGHADAVQGCIERLGGSLDTIKATMAQIGGLVQSMTPTGKEDALVKQVLAGYAAEQYEVAAYTALLHLARVQGDPETLRVCERNLREDQDMARWLLEHLPFATDSMAARLADEDVEDARTSAVQPEAATGF